MKITKLNNKGIIHHLGLGILIAGIEVAIVGTGLYVYSNAHKSHAAGWSTVGMYNNAKIFACSTAVSGYYGNLEHVGVFSNGGDLSLGAVQNSKYVQYVNVTKSTEGFIWASVDLNEHVNIISEPAGKIIDQLGPGTSNPWKNIVCPTSTTSNVGSGKVGPGKSGNSVGQLRSSNSTNSTSTSTTSQSPNTTTSTTTTATSLTAAQIQTCQTHFSAISTVLGTINTRTEDQINFLNETATNVESFYIKQNKTVANYQQLVGVVTNDEATVQKGYSTLKNDSNFNCTGSNPKGTIITYQSDLSAEINNLQSLRTAVINLINAVATANGVSISMSNPPTLGGLS